MISRRRVLVAGSAAAVWAAMPSGVLPAASGGRFDGLAVSLAKLEKDCGGRLGVAVLDTASGQSAGYRKDERFAMCSTFKMLLAAAVLQRIDAGKEQLDRTLPIPATISLQSSPITQEHAGGAMTIRELAEAIITRSDNTAANLLLATIGGPSGITRFARTLGDRITRLDRTETTLNEALPGDPRDTTSPAAMVETWRKVLLGTALSQASRALLTEWLIANKTGDMRLRAGLKAGWRVGDKTGANGENTTNDVAVIWPVAGGAPVLVAAYLTMCPGPETKRNAVLAEVGRFVALAIDGAEGRGT
jgi:beta-lactamase class A